MTSTLPTRRRPRSALRRAHIYGYLTLNHDDRTVVEFGYGGQSCQRRGARDAQHRDDKPWQDLIVGSPHIIADGWWTADELDRIELAVIAGDWSRVESLAVAEAARRGAIPDLSGLRACRAAGRRPRYNVRGNEDNPDRIEPAVALAQRWERDTAAGLSPWVPEDQRADGPVFRQPAAPPWWHRSRWTGWHVLPLGWLVLSALVWNLIHGPWDWFWPAAGVPQVVGWSPPLAALAGLAVTGWGWRKGARWARRARRR